ncbi:MAG: hypothetical protein CEN87_400 [Parcubacteria group bacterium Licking1014_1]|nr:MAG: hypothetical protein CEN87_400 [Parcubacteria group bacterium Licking1014_1]
MKNPFKNRTAVLLVLFFCFCFNAKAESAAIPGGIVYSDGKNAIYYDFETKESKSLTSDLADKAIVKYPFAISDNGKFLLWLQNSRFYVRELPIGIPRPAQYAGMTATSRGENKTEYKQQDKDVKDIIWQGSDIKNLTLSPDGARFAFDSMVQKPSWVFTNKTVPSSKGLLPFYAKMMDSYSGIFYLSTILHIIRPNEKGPLDPRYGSPVQIPPAPMFMASRQDLPASLSNVREKIGTGGEVDTTPMLCYKATLKKSAHYLAFQNLQNWKKGSKLAAYIYQIDNQWGPIEIRTLDSKTWGGANDKVRQGTIYFNAKAEESMGSLRKPREWEIRVSFKSCEGLYWKPDGSLTVQSAGDLYSIDASKIQEGIDRSEVEKRQSIYNKNQIALYPVNNVFAVEPRLISRGINASCIFWVSDEAFLFLAKDMTVWLWNKGAKEKALDSPIPSEFYYCAISPFRDIVHSNETGALPAIYGKDGATESVWGRSENNGRSYCFNIGPVRTSWTGGVSGTPGGKKDSVVIWIKEALKQKNGLEFVLPEETDLKDIKDPTAYEYRTEYQWNEFYNQKLSELNVNVPLGKIIILKSGNNYAALKPLSVKLGKTIAIREGKTIGDVSIPIWLDYEWKFWPNTAPSVITKK